MSHKQNVSVDCSQCNCSTDVEYLICISCYDEVQQQLKEKEGEVSSLNEEVTKLEEELESLDSRYKYYKDLVQGCDTCGAKLSADSM